jgi:hypothetical protein
VSAALRALAVTLLIEVPVVALGFPGQRVRMALVALVVNTVTNLTLNVLLPAIPLLRPHSLFIGETLAVLVEALAYARAGRPRDLGRALALSGVSNALSYELGGAVVAALMARSAAGFTPAP